MVVFFPCSRGVRPLLRVLPSPSLSIVGEVVADVSESSTMITVELGEDAVVTACDVSTVEAVIEEAESVASVETGEAVESTVEAVVVAGADESTVTSG